MAAISQTVLSNAFSWTKMLEFRFKFHWSLFLKAQSMIFQHWFRCWLVGAKPLSEPMMVILPTHICVTRPQWVKLFNSPGNLPYLTLRGQIPLVPTTVTTILVLKLKLRWLQFIWRSGNSIFRIRLSNLCTSFSVQLTMIKPSPVTGNIMVETERRHTHAWSRNGTVWNTNKMRLILSLIPDHETYIFIWKWCTWERQCDESVCYNLEYIWSMLTCHYTLRVM